MRRMVFGLLAGLAVIAISAVQSQSQPDKNPAVKRLKDKDKAEDKDSDKDKGKDKEKPAKPAVDRSADEAAIRANVAAFQKAYNSGDAKAIAALFTSDGQIEDKEGNVSEGREAIAKTFRNVFEATPDKQIEVFIESIRFIGADLAVEKGITKESDVPGEAPDYDRYTAVHVKKDGKWLMALARDEEGPVGSANEQLRPLAFLIGEWVDDGGSTVVRSSGRWSKDQSFLLQEFKVTVNGKETMNISQRIGWDPLTKRIRS